MIKALAVPLAIFLASVGIASSQTDPQACAVGEKRLPVSGLCPSEASKFLKPIDPKFEKRLEMIGCKPVIWDGSFLGAPLLYHATQCKGEPAALEASFGAHSGGIYIWGGGTNEAEIENNKLAIVLIADLDNPFDRVVRWVQESIGHEGDGSAVANRCKPRKAPEHGADAWVIDDFLAYRNNGHKRISCGSFGYSESSEAYWRITQGFAFYFDLGNDGYSDFDPQSLTLLEKSIEGRWQRTPSTPTD